MSLARAFPLLASLPDPQDRLQLFAVGGLNTLTSTPTGTVEWLDTETNTWQVRTENRREHQRHKFAFPAAPLSPAGR